MGLFRRRRKSQSADTAHVPDASGYDAQSDLATPTAEPAAAASEGFVPFAGQVAPEPPAAGYDAMRDTGIDPG